MAENRFTFKPSIINSDNSDIKYNQNESVPASVSFPVYSANNKQINQSVGFPEMNVEKSIPIDSSSDSNPNSVSFNGLISDWFINPEQKFSVHAIPENEFEEAISAPPPPNIFEAIRMATDQNVAAHLNKQKNDTGNHRKVNNWITRLIAQKGEDYITSGRLSADEVGRNAERIIDDIIAGRIDYSQQGHYLIMPVFIETLISFCANKLAINRAIYYALGYIYSDYTSQYNIDPKDTKRIEYLSYITNDMSRNIAHAISIVNQDIVMYETIYNRLLYVQSSKNASSLFNLASELNYARKQIKNRY